MGHPLNASESQRSIAGISELVDAKATVATPGTTVDYTVQTEAPFIIMMGDKDFHYDFGSGIAKVATSFRVPANTPWKIVSPSATQAGEGPEGLGREPELHAGSIISFDAPGGATDIYILEVL